jgi:L-alanine-DL-glutamate epimerase-like enolase superfamily enzyme
MSLRPRCPYPIHIDELAQHDDDLTLALVRDVADGLSVKVSKAGGLTPGRRQRDIARSAGLTASVQDTAGSEIAFAAIVHLAATFQERLLRGVLNCADMVTTRVATFTPAMHLDGLLPPDAPGLGIDVNESVLGEPERIWRL